MDIYDLLREPIKEAQGYVLSGKALPRTVDGKEPIKMNANENHLGPSPKVLAAIQSELKNIYLYPFEQIETTRQALANWLHFEPENICMANGSLSLIYAIGDVFLNPDDEVLLCSPTYPAYVSLPSRYGAKVVSVASNNFVTDGNQLLRSITNRTKLCVIVNPNNPTGTKMSNEDLQTFIDHVPDHVITVIDEAYIEWVTEKNYHDATKFIKSNKKVIVLRTFSKVFGLAGIRFGYAITIPAIAKYLGIVEANYSPNRLAYIAVRTAMNDMDHVKASIANNTKGRNYIMKELRRLGCEVVESSASFVYFAANINAHAMTSELKKRGIYIRNFGAKYNRVSVGLPSENKAFIKAVEEILPIGS